MNIVVILITTTIMNLLVASVVITLVVLTTVQATSTNDIRWQQKHERSVQLSSNSSPNKILTNVTETSTSLCPCHTPGSSWELALTEQAHPVPLEYCLYHDDDDDAQKQQQQQSSSPLALLYWGNELGLAVNMWNDEYDQPTCQTPQVTKQITEPQARACWDQLQQLARDHYHEVLQGMCE